MKHVRHLWVSALTITLVLGGQFPSANASLTGEIEMRSTCTSQGPFQVTWVNGLPVVTAPCATAYNSMASSYANTTKASATFEATVIQESALEGFAAAIDQAHAQFERLTGLQTTFDLDPSHVEVRVKRGSSTLFYMNKRISLEGCGIGMVQPMCGEVSDGSGSSSPNNDTLKKFRWMNNSRMGIHYRPTGEDEEFTGGYILSMYQATEKPRADADFAATSLVGSLTPKGRRLTWLEGAIMPHKDTGIELASSYPNAMYDRSAGDSWSIKADLSREFGSRNVIGAAFSIARTWIYGAGSVGGGFEIGPDRHYMAWRKKAGVYEARNTEGIQTWKVPNHGTLIWDYTAAFAWKTVS